MQANGATPPQSPEQMPVEALPTAGGELDLFALFMLLRTHVRRIVLFAFVTFAVVALYTEVVKPQFSSTVTFLVPANQGGSGAAAALQAAGAMDLLQNSATTVYVDMLKSHAVADALINRFDLKHRLKVDSLSIVETSLATMTKVDSEREGLISVTVVNSDPKLATDLANGYLEELEKLNQRMSVGSAGLQRHYYEQEMVKEKNQLADAEVALRETQESTGVIAPQMQEQSGISAEDQTRAQLRARQVQRGALLQSETPQAPDVVRLDAEISSLEGQLHAMQSGGGGSAVATPNSKVPSKVLAYVRGEREVKFHEALFEMLSRQFEAAKEQEAKDFSMIQVLDPAVIPERKSWPPRTKYSLIAFLVGGFLGILYTLAEAFVRVILRNPENRQRLSQFSSGKTAPAARL